MTDILFILKSSILPLFLVLGVAIIFERVAKPDITGLNSLALQLLSPIFIFKRVTDSAYVFKDIAPTIYFMLAFTVIMAAIGTGLAKASKMAEPNKTAFISNATFMNFGNFGVPLILFAFGKEAEVDAIMIWLAFYVPLSTYGIWLADDDKRVRHAVMNILKIPLFPAFLLALFMNELKISVPTILISPMEFFAVATIPLNTIVYGLQLSQVRYRRGVTKFVIICSAIRLILSPIVAFGLVKLFNITSLSAQVLIVVMATPMASGPIMYAMAFKKDYQISAATVFVTTILSAITLPIVISLVKMYF